MPMSPYQIAEHARRRKAILEAGRAIREAKGAPPTLNELSDVTGLDSTCCRKHRDALVKSGEWTFGTNPVGFQPGNPGTPEKAPPKPETIEEMKRRIQARWDDATELSRRGVEWERDEDGNAVPLVAPVTLPRMAVDQPRYSGGRVIRKLVRAEWYEQ